MELDPGARLTRGLGLHALLGGLGGDQSLLLAYTCTNAMVGSLFDSL